MKSSQRMAELWGISERRVTAACNEGKIPGAVKSGRKWMIPDDAEKPADGRVVSGKYAKPDTPGGKKALPVGISDYVRAQSDYYYVDKTLLIRDILDRNALVTLFTRPRRFGKTLNMDMLRVFFEASSEDSVKYFKDKAIWQCGPEYRAHQGKYPVIFLTLKDVKFNSWQSTLSKIGELIQEEFGRHSELEDSAQLADYEKVYYKKVLSGQADEVELASSVQKLSKMLCAHYGIAPVIIIDEYDTPIQEGYAKDFYEEIIGFMRNFFSGAFKDNGFLSYGFLTGILRIAQESIFSGLNNLSVSSVLDNEYDAYFGFTEAEIRDMLAYYGVPEKEAELKAWYDGYIFGRTAVYNPWSVINYLSKGCVPQAYWVNTGRNEILEDVLHSATKEIAEKLYALVQGDRVIARIDQNVIYRLLTEDDSNVYSILLVAGYLKATEKELQGDGTWLCEVAIPNREIAAVYKSEILSHLMRVGAVSRTTADRIAESLYVHDLSALQKGISDYMDKSISYYDSASEGFYHGLVLGLIAMMDNQYTIKSNRESGDGRYDISMFPRRDKYPGILMELKSGKDLDDGALEALSSEALSQIDEKRYDTEMKSEGVKEILKLGIAFSGKRVQIKTQCETP